MQGASSFPAAEEVAVHVFQGPIILDGRPVPDGTTVVALIGEVRVAGIRTAAGRYRLEVRQPISLTGRTVEFSGWTADGRRFWFYTTGLWQPGGETTISLEGGIQRGELIPGQSRSGNSPTAPQDGQDQSGNSPSNQKEGQTYFINGSASFEGINVEDGIRVTAYIDGVRISGTITNGGRFRLVVPQQPGESFAGKIVELRSTVQGTRVSWPQTSTWQSGGQTTVTLEARLGQGRNESFPREDPRRVEREGFQLQPEGGQPPSVRDPSTPSIDKPALTGSTRGFFTNSQIGQLGSVNKLFEPAFLAVIGILITLAATTMQMMRGN